MDIQHIFLDDSNAEHRELAIHREGEVHLVRLTDTAYTTYGTLCISATDHTALFHYGIVEALNTLPFISESGHGLDSWDEAFLHHSRIDSMLSILDEQRKQIEPDRAENVLLGWHREPVAVAYWRKIESSRFLSFLDRLHAFAEEARQGGYDLEFIL
ncbi:hypothetical protein INT08_06085 [Prosthecochloris sp. N3]|uniref:DUF1877 family protein n=1 Tax=Prosthecochloris ethylica TaxID=2743976 RepID=A0ABR9XRY7_9CHLB|nr:MULTISPECIES: hypothetical protein [Prosthecochloris]MBF0586908.1 hypothetical protein [Prosthecochloris ethylica]MBF0636744.1 hypothetical protein [Prosthecochloris ethylica]NUK48420.1 hypothetical protein [Prosthecochloris ethylica]RNA64259.1 hypothetical protein CR163_002760 [Prosthecochloris sp. ZM_2]